MPSRPHAAPAAEDADARTGSHRGVLRKALFLPLDDLLGVVRELVHLNVSRSGLDRCLRRYVAGQSI
jgi:hypothetical protein